MNHADVPLRAASATDILFTTAYGWNRAANVQDFLGAKNGNAMFPEMNSAFKTRNILHGENTPLDRPQQMIYEHLHSPEIRR
jgi:hypothetical protein